MYNTKLTTTKKESHLSSRTMIILFLHLGDMYLIIIFTFTFSLGHLCTLLSI